MKRTRVGPKDDAGIYCRLLLDKQKETRNGLGTKIDLLAISGRVAEDDQGPLSHDAFISLSLNNIDYEQLVLVEEALDRLERGEFGVCQDCGTMIPKKRLLAVPWARYCVACQEQAALQSADADEIKPSPAGVLGRW